MVRAVDRLLLRVKDLLLVVRRATVPQNRDRPSEQHTAVARHESELLADMLANIALRDLTLVETLLGELDDAEQKENDPDRLEFLFRIDHLATRLRRSSENLLVLAGHEAPSSPDGPVRLLDVIRAAVSESVDYGRIDIGSLPVRSLAPHAVDDVAHLIAELLDNALTMSPAHTKVMVSGSASNDTVLVTVEDDGIGIPVDRLAVYNMRLAASSELDADAARQMGLYVVANLARRHGIYVQIQVRPGGGTTVVLALPSRILLDADGPADVPAMRIMTAAPAALPVTTPVAPAAEPMVPKEPVPASEQTTAGGLPRRVRTSGGPRPVDPVELAPPSDPQSLFDDLAAFDEGRHAAHDARPSWEGPWQN